MVHFSKKAILKNYHFSAESPGIYVEGDELIAIPTTGGTTGILPARELGEIVLKGGNVSLGYYENPEMTATIRKDGWHLTGDIGYLDEEGYLYIVDRKKDMIITGGFNVYSVEVEKVLNNHADIDLGAVIGIPHDHWGEQVIAHVRLKSDAILTEAEIIAYCKAQLGSIKAPKQIVFVDEFPRTSIGKLNKKAMRAPYWAGKTRNVH